MRKRFDEELRRLHESLIEMGTLNEKALELIPQLFENIPAGEMERIKTEIKEYETKVDDMERDIQSRSMQLLISQQPVARDLRSISTAINIITDMERITDQAYDIAEIAMYFKGKELIREPVHIRGMVQCCISMMRRSVEAFVSQDRELARQVIDSDDEVDNLFLEMRSELIDMIGRDRNCGEQAIDLMIIAKYLERIADHAVNVAEWVIFNITGTHKDNRLI